MNKYCKTVLVVVLTTVMISSLFAEDKDKRAQTGLKFLSIALDARASALSGAMTAQGGNSTSMFYNPAGMAGVGKTINASLGQVKWIADISYYYGSLSYSPSEGKYGTFGLSFVSVEYGDLQGTIRAENSQGYLETGTFRPSGYVMGLGYAKSLTDKFSIGAHVKYAEQNLGGGITSFEGDENANSEALKTDVLAFDFGLQYKAGYKDLTIGMSVRNFSDEPKYYAESFQLPLIFEMGVFMNVLEIWEMDPKQHALLVAIDATHPRDYEEQLDIGIEYKLLDMVALRMGYTLPSDEQGMSFGAGFNKDFAGAGFGVDYAYTPFGIFTDVHRFSFQFSF